MTYRDLGGCPDGLGLRYLMLKVFCLTYYLLKTNNLRCFVDLMRLRKITQKCSKSAASCSKSAAEKKTVPPLAIDIQEGIVTALIFYIFLLSVPGVNRKILCTFAAPKYCSVLNKLTKFEFNL